MCGSTRATISPSSSSTSLSTPWAAGCWGPKLMVKFLRLGDWSDISLPIEGARHLNRDRHRTASHRLTIRVVPEKRSYERCNLERRFTSDVQCEIGDFHEISIAPGCRLPCARDSPRLLDGRLRTRPLLTSGPRLGLSGQLPVRQLRSVHGDCIGNERLLRRQSSLRLCTAIQGISVTGPGCGRAPF